MERVIIILAASLLLGSPGWASDKSDIRAVLSQWNDADEAKAVAACADDAAVIDDIPPFEWHGPGACLRWQKDYDAYVAKTGMTDSVGTIGDPRQLTISGDRAYAVAPATFAFTRKGKRVKVIATATFALLKTSAGWRITAWSWGARSIQ